MKATTTDELSFKLAPSLTEGVGVFAMHKILKGTELRIFSDEEIRFIPFGSELLKNEALVKYCNRYCVRDDEGYSCAKNFNKMDIGWYLNHSKSPNAYQKNYHYFALKDINREEEITIDYDAL